jgi:DMSO/TMAO reductase YedYZ molybdopterin-dependent catalytic subunit
MKLPLLALLILLAPQAALTQSLTVIGLTHKSISLSPKDLADLPRAEVSAGAPPKTYEGPTLTSVVRSVGAPSGPLLHGKPVKDYVVVTGADGFAAVLSLAETDPWLHKGSVILADTAGGAALAPHEGPLRLMVEGDVRPSRSVRNVVKIELEAAP